MPKDETAEVNNLVEAMRDTLDSAFDTFNAEEYTGFGILYDKKPYLVIVSEATLREI